MSRYIIFLILLFAVCACSLHGSKDINNLNDSVRPENESLREAVDVYWNYRVKGDLYHSFDYERNAYKKAVTRQYYISNFSRGIQYNSFKVVEILPEGTGPEGLTVVRLQVDISYPGMLLMKVPDHLKQTRLDYWFKAKDGRWYHVISQMGKFY